MREELEAAIREAPDDPAPYEVYADWLDQQGDPRGRWMLLQQARARPGIDAGLEVEIAHLANDEALVPRLRAQMLGPARQFSPLRWRYGVVQGAYVYRFMADPTFAVTMRTLFAHPAAAFLRALVLGHSVEQDKRPIPGLNGALDALVKAPDTLESLRLIQPLRFHPHVRPNPVILPKANRIFESLPGLRTLVLDADECDIKPFTAPKLERLELVCNTLRGSLRAALELADLPELRVLHFGVAEEGAENVDFLSRMKAEKLEELGLHGKLGKHADQAMVAALLEWRGLGRLRRLVLHHPRVRGASFDGSTLLAAHGRWKHLEELRIVPTYPGECALLAGLPNVRILPAEPTPPLPVDPLESLCT